MSISSILSLSVSAVVRRSSLYSPNLHLSCTIRALQVFALVFADKLAAANLGLNLVDSKLGHNWLPDNCRSELTQLTIQQILKLIKMSLNILHQTIYSFR